MKHPFLLLLGVAGVLLAGCTTPFRAPPVAAHIKLDQVSSRAVLIDKIWLEQNHGSLFLKGCVLKRPGALTTSYTHLDVTVFGSDGRMLRSSVERFVPRNIYRRGNRPGHANYELLLDLSPQDVARIEVRAHEDPQGLHHGE